MLSNDGLKKCVDYHGQLNILTVFVHTLSSLFLNFIYKTGKSKHFKGERDAPTFNWFVYDGCYSHVDLGEKNAVFICDNCRRNLWTS